MNWNVYLNFLIAMLSIVNPIGIVPMWTELTSDKEGKIRSRVAFLLVVTAFIILSLFLLVGKYMLNFFSIDLPVFKIAGGILLLIAGLSMVEGSATSLKNRDEEGESLRTIAVQRYKKILVPMAIPRLAGPGSITTVIIFGSKSESVMDYSMMIVVVLVTLTLLYLFFSKSYWIEKHIDTTVLVVLTRLFGIIVAAIALQFMLEGFGEVFPDWLEGNSSIENSNSK